jgi:hypothetical protein
VHYHAEVIISSDVARGDIAKVIEEALAEYDENYQGEDGQYSKHAFFDWYVIGGRWSGDKAMALLDQGRLNDFRAWLDARGVTVSGIQCGKQSLDPESQIYAIDTKWNEMFPSADGAPVPCPLFNHSQTDDGSSPGDIMRLKDITAAHTAACVLILGQNWNNTRFEIKYQLHRELWTGSNYQEAAWEGGVLDAVELYKRSIDSYREEYKEANTPTDDWWVVTMDYHR